MNRMTEPAHIRFSSPYLVFCREQRPLLPAHLTNSDRERLLGQNWRKLSMAGSAAYTRGLTQLITTGRGGFCIRAPTPPTNLPTPPSAATFLAGCAAADSVAVSVCASVSAERTAKTAPPYPDPEDQPAAKRRAFSTAATRRAYQDGEAGPLLDPRLSPFPPMSLQTLSQPAAPPPGVAVPPKPRRRAPELRYLPLELLNAAASHRTGVGPYLDHQESSSAAGDLYLYLGGGHRDRDIAWHVSSKILESGILERQRGAWRFVV